MMKTIFVYVAVALISGLMAWLLFGGDRDAKDPASEAPSNKIDDPLWYRDIESREALERAGMRLQVMATTEIAATSTGNVKDEIALLCADEQVVQLVVDRFHERRKQAAPLSAFMEIFARKKHPAFAELVPYGLKGRSYETKSNAKLAAITQRDPSYVDLLGSMIDDESGEDQRTIEALIAIGNDAALEVVRRKLPQLGREGLLGALPFLAEQRYQPAIPEISNLLEHESVDIRILAAWAISKLGNPRGFRILKESVEDEKIAANSRAQAVQYLSDTAGARAMEVYDRQARQASNLVGFESLIAAIKHGHSEALDRVLDDLDHEDPSRRFQSYAVLGRVAHAPTREKLQRDFRAHRPEELAAFVNGHTQAKSLEILPLLRELFLAGDPYTKVAEGQFHTFADRALPALDAIRRESLDDDRKRRLMAILVSIHNTGSLETLEKIDVGTERKMILFKRTSIRQLELGLAKYR